MSKHKKGPSGVLKVPQQKKALSPYGRHVVTCMTGNAKVPSPNPPLPAITAACAALDVSQAAMPGSKAATARRDADYLALLLLLHHPAAAVEMLLLATVLACDKTHHLLRG